MIKEIFAPHSHDAADSVDDTLESTAAGIRTVKISLLVLGLTALIQIVIVVMSGSVALAADTIHNFADALTAVPLWIAFALGAKPATRRYTYGFGRVEDLAGSFVVAMITMSAIIAGYEAIARLIHPQQIEHVGWVALAGLVGFIGNEWVALYRIRVGHRIGSAALIAHGRGFAHRADPEHDRAEDDRCDHHLDQVDEHRPEHREAFSGRRRRQPHDHTGYHCENDREIQPVGAVSAFVVSRQIRDRRTIQGGGHRRFLQVDIGRDSARC